MSSNLHDPDHSCNPAHFPGQPLLVELPTEGTVPLALKTPVNKYTWKVKDARRNEQKSSARWIVPSSKY